MPGIRQGLWKWELVSVSFFKRTHVCLFKYLYIKYMSNEKVKFKPPEEWMRQAEYDIETAMHLFNTGRYPYVVFMCHLSIEKALKGLFSFLYDDNPAKTHNLLYLLKKLLDKVDIKLPDEHFELLKELNILSVPVRYPDDLQDILKDFNKIEIKRIYDSSKKVVKWVREKLIELKK